MLMYMENCTLLQNYAIEKTEPESPAQREDAGGVFGYRGSSLTEAK